MLSAAPSRLPTSPRQLLRRARGQHTPSPAVVLLEATSAAALVAEVASPTALLPPTAAAIVLQRLAAVGLLLLRKWTARSIPTASSVRVADIPDVAALLPGGNFGFRLDAAADGSLKDPSTRIIS